MPYTIAFRKNAAGPIVANSDRADRDAGAEPEQRGPLEARRHLAAEQLVGRGGDRDEPEDRWDAGRRRCALQPARSAEHEEIGRQAGQDHRRRTECRPEQHHPVVPDAVGQDPEGRGEDQLRDIEHRVEEREGRRGDRLAAMLGKLGEVDREHRTRKAGAETERECAGQHGPQRTIHAPEA